MDSTARQTCEGVAGTFISLGGRASKERKGEDNALSRIFRMGTLNP